MQAGLMKLKTKTSKFQALKAQLDFRKKILEQNSADKSVFCLSKNKKNFRSRRYAATFANYFHPHLGVIRKVSLAKELSINGVWMGATSGTWERFLM